MDYLSLWCQQSINPDECLWYTAVSHGKIHTTDDMLPSYLDCEIPEAQNRKDTEKQCRQYVEKSSWFFGTPILIFIYWWYHSPPKTVIWQVSNHHILSIDKVLLKKNFRNLKKSAQLSFNRRLICCCHRGNMWKAIWSGTTVPLVQFSIRTKGLFNFNIYGDLHHIDIDFHLQPPSFWDVNRFPVPLQRCGNRSSKTSWVVLYHGRNIDSKGVTLQYWSVQGSSLNLHWIFQGSFNTYWYYLQHYSPLTDLFMFGSQKSSSLDLLLDFLVPILIMKISKILLSIFLLLWCQQSINPDDCLWYPDVSHCFLMAKLILDWQCLAQPAWLCDSRGTTKEKDWERSRQYVDHLESLSLSLWYYLPPKTKLIMISTIISLISCKLLFGKSRYLCQTIRVLFAYKNFLESFF